jgi:hypothetical protein
VVIEVATWIEELQEEERRRTGQKPSKGKVISEKLLSHPDFLRAHPEHARNKNNGHGAQTPSPMPRFSRETD